MPTVLLLLQLLAAVAHAGLQEIELRSPWSITNQNKSIQVLGEAPGEIYTTLWKAGKIGDPRYRYNDLLSRWVAYDNWTYTMLIDVKEDIIKTKVKYLEFQSVDSVTNIYFNGKLLGKTNNAFIHYRYKIVNILPTKNNVTVQFMSPVTYAKDQWSRYPYLVPPSCWPASYKGECHVNFIRTIASNFAWDWGPAFPGTGFLKPVKIVAFDMGRLLGVKFDMNKNLNGNSWSLSADLDVESIASQTICVSVALHEIALSISKCWRVPKAQSKQRILVSDKIQNPQLWWPNGYGEQKLYECEVSLLTKNQVIDKRIYKIGFRTIELVQNPVGGSKTGLTFYFVVNGVKVFIKGSNWVPLDNFLPTLTKDRYRFFLTSAQAANMNMIRVFGGGLYEYDWFYELADELGIFIWQDMMFACAMFPVNAEFLANVGTEIRHQIWRLQHHPSIALWSGSNENELAVGSGWYNAGPMNPLYLRDFRTLYLNVVKKVIQELDPHRIFIISSPTNGQLSMMNGGVSKNPADNRYGDVHFYTYTGPLWNASSFPITRFTSEFGFQSLPSLPTWTTATDLGGDIAVEGPLMQHREHHPLGLTPIFSVTLEYFTPPNKISDSHVNFTNWVYLSQANQAMIYRTEVEMLRRHQCTIDAESQGLTMGAMYWMLNDIWQAPTWASVERTGRWKMLHYFARRFYADVLLSPNFDGTTLTVHLGATPKYSQPQTMFRGVVNTTCYDFQSLTPVGGWMNEIHEDLDCPVVQVYHLPISTALQKCGCLDASKCVGAFTYADASGNVVADNWILFTKPKDIPFSSMNRTNLKITKVIDNKESFEIDLKIDRPDLFVWLDVRNISGWFSDNGFLMKEGTKSISFRPFAKHKTSIEEFQSQLTVTSLSNLYLS